MSTIAEQIELEEQMVARGAERYKSMQREAEKSGRGSDLDYSRRIMSEFMLPLVEELTIRTSTKGAGRFGAARIALSTADPWNAIYIGLKEILNSFTFDEPVVQTAGRIGRMIEDEIRFTRLKELHSAYYRKVQEEFERKRVQDYRYKQRVLTHVANQANDQWVPWDTKKRVQVGMALIDLVHSCTDLIEVRRVTTKRGYQMIMSPTPQCEDWIAEHEEARALLAPEKLPCIVPPDNWTSIYQGGYYTPELRKSTPLIKTRTKRHYKLLEQADLSLIMEAANIAQATSWQVNTKVLDVAKAVWAASLGVGMPSTQKLVPSECPVRDIKKEDMTPEQKEIFEEWKSEAADIYTQEKERVGKSFQVARILRMAGEYRDRDRFWFVWYYDFRGRMYTTTAGFSVQGPDLAKGLLQFADAKPLGKVGWNWLRIHGANTYGNDKVPFAERIKFITELEPEILRCAADPLSYTSFWGNADKPYQFLAFVFDYAEAVNGRLVGKSPEEYCSRLSLGQDGSCNGLQNFSAMLRDSVGGAATNLLPSDRPSDIYAQVAEICTRKVRSLADGGDPEAKSWVAFWDKNSDGKMSRTMAKRPVMTLPYGSTRQSCTKYLWQSIRETDPKFFTLPFKAAVWLTPYLWDSIGEVVKSARVAMGWLQKVCSKMGRVNRPCIWSTADGFVVLQHSRKIESYQVTTQLAGKFQVRIGEYSPAMDKRKNRNSVSPNFVHSQDAAHLRSTIRIAKKLGITHFALIHDDYGTHACDVPLLHKAIREAFINMYTKYDPLDAFYAQQTSTGTRVPAVPQKGTLDINLVRKSPYFFS